MDFDETSDAGENYNLCHNMINKNIGVIKTQMLL